MKVDEIVERVKMMTFQNTEVLSRMDDIMKQFTKNNLAISQTVTHQERNLRQKIKEVEMRVEFPLVKQLEQNI